MLAYPHLFSPVKVGNVLFRNRILASATGYIETNGKALPDSALNYYARKAMGGAAAVVVGECQVDPPGGGSRGGPCIDMSDRGWGPFLYKLSERIARHGAVPSAELSHAGRYSHTGYGPSDGEVDPGRPCHAMSEEQILSTIQAYVHAARLAQASGFPMVTVHGGHGWLPQQFFSPYYNHRTDRWGGSAENRARFALAICDGIHEACGKDYPVEIRISATELEDGYDLDEGVEFARLLDGHADILHVTLGVHGSMSNDHWLAFTPTMFQEEGVNVERAARIKQIVRQSLVAVVASISDPVLMEEIIAEGKADFVALARQLLCDPDTPNKARDGRSGDIRRCMRCMGCWSSLMRGFRCAINPETGREDEALAALPPAKPKQVLVAGGGIAGMQAALTAAQNGHSVVLCDKADRLGGGVACEEDVPFKWRLKAYIQQQERLLRNAGVEIRLSCEVTPTYLQAQGADVLIIATGSRPLVPGIPGIELAACANDVYRDPSLAGSRVAIIGAGLVGAELALYLHSLGREVTLVEQAAAIRSEGNRVHALALAGELRRAGISQRFNAQATRIEKDAVVLANGERTPCDTAVYATGQEADTEAVYALSGCAPQVIPIGDCAGSGNIMDAVKAAWTAARDIGRF
ncbi:MAG: NAD(P)/FAD-dependent oxidoreductase [Clostridiales bacterium]|nr:NAD(P)/FAD-dependent oxidoreductase [Clostridiales bacterium]